MKEYAPLIPIPLRFLPSAVQICRCQLTVSWIYRFSYYFIYSILLVTLSLIYDTQLLALNGNEGKNLTSDENDARRLYQFEVNCLKKLNVVSTVIRSTGLNQMSFK